MKMRLMRHVAPTVLMLFATPALAQTAGSALTYQQPPAPIADILDARPTPGASVSPDQKTLVLFQRSNLPTIAELAEPMLRLAGYRINPRNNGPANSRISWVTGLSFQSVEGGAARAVALPEGARFTGASWSPDGRSVAFLMDQPEGMALWVADVGTATAREVFGARVNAATGAGMSWLPDSSGLLVRAVPADRGAAPDVTAAPAGPPVAAPGVPEPTPRRSTPRARASSVAGDRAPTR